MLQAFSNRQKFKETAPITVSFHRSYVDPDSSTIQHFLIQVWVGWPSAQVFANTTCFHKITNPTAGDWNSANPTNPHWLPLWLPQVTWYPSFNGPGESE